ncbi:tetratricopeptide repeat protein [Sandaracinus amylolyticus]|uniref:tetratricopeptide repeat protein n=1 Tax=Sandaracinus amylolyticus TaxID=927083 RepID=UPI00069CD439|nr:tetratricopeptide repeat protein [Sandaracinus amylolyticus]
MLDVSHLLGLLQEDPDHSEALRELREAIESGDAARLGSDPLRLISAARRGHQERAETWTAAQLLDLEATLSAQDPDREAQLRKELARIHREELLDDEAAMAAYERAKALRPGDDEIAEAIDALAASEQNWKEIAKRFVDEAETSSDASLRTSLLASAGTLVWKHKKRGRDKDTDRLFLQALESDAGDPRANKLYEQILRKREKWAELAQVLLDAAEKTRSRDDRIGFYLRAARVLGRRLESAERAAACYERILDFVPGHPEAMRFLVEFFTQREQWDHLVALYDDALRGRQKLESEQGILLQIGMVHWRFRGSPAEAEPYFARLRKVEPAHPGMLAFYREHLPQTGDHAKLLTVLGDAQRVTTDARLKVELSVELARAAQASGAADRAIDAWKTVQRQDPRNPEALRALRELYRQTEKWNALVEVLKGEVDSLPADSVSERVALLREMVVIYRDHLRLDVMVINSWNAILALAPDDGDALEALAATYEQMGRWNDLIQVLTRKADAAKEPREQVALYMRVARLWIERFANYNQATRPLELVIERDPGNRDALAQLKDIYTKKRAWKQLFDVQRAEAELASDPDARHAMRIELARVAGERLHRHADAISLWKEVLGHEPSHAEALDALEKLAEREKDWSTLGEVLERRVRALENNGAAPDDKERIKLLTKLGILYGEQAKDPAKAASAWKRVLAADPKNGRALRTLRESFVAAGDWEGLEALYAEQNDWDGLAEVLGNAADRSDSAEQKIALSFRAAAVYEERIEEPHRAFRSYERVLAADPVNERAARKLIALYEKDEKWSRLPALYEVVLAAIDPQEIEERVALLSRLRVIAGDHLNDAQAAFRHQLEAWTLAPASSEVRDALWSATEKASAWDRLANALAARLEKAPSEERLWLRRSIARVAGERLGDVERAIAQLRDIVADDPHDAEAIKSLDRIYRSGSRWSALRGLLLARIEHEMDETERWVLLHELAKLEQSELGDEASAAEHWRAALAIDPSDREALLALDRLAERAGRWIEVIELAKQRRELAQSDDEKVELTTRIGELLVERTPDVAAAIDELATVLASRKADRRAIAALETLLAGDALDAAQRDAVARLLEGAYEAAGEWSKLRASVQRRLASTTDAEEKRQLRLRFAELSSSRVDDPESAYAALESAFLDAPADQSIWERLFAAADRAHKHEHLAQAIATAIEAGEMPAEDLTRLAEKVAQIYDVVLGRPADAEPFHRRVLAGDPQSEPSFLALKELYTNAERWDDLQVLYRNRIAQTVDADAKLDLLLQVCFLFEELIDDPELAIRAYRDVLELEPGHAASRRALERLYERTQRWRDLAALLEQEIIEGTGDVTSLTFRLGALHESKLGEPAQAVDRYEAVIRLDGDHEGARSALERLLSDRQQRHRIALILEPVHEQRRAWADLARVLEVQLEQIHDPGTRLSLLTRIAEIHENRLANNEAALGAWSRAVECDPADGGARAELARVATMQSADARRAAVLERAIDSVEGQPSLQSELLLEVATLWDDKLADVERAERAYERLVEVASDDPEMVLRASRSLERIHSSRGDHAKLAADLRRQAKLENEAGTRRALLVRLAELLETKQNDLEGAIAVHNERLELDPDDVGALAALERLYEQLARWQPLIGVLQSRDALASGDTERKQIALRIGAIWDEKLTDRDNAIVAYNEVIERFGPDHAALAALTRLYEQAERWSDLLEVVQMVHDLVPGAAEKAQLRFHAAELMRKRTGELERAIETYAEVLDSLPSHEGAVTALREVMSDPASSSRLAAARVLRPRFEAQGSYPALLDALDVLAESDDPSERLSALRRAAEVADIGLNEPGRAFDLASRALRAGLGEPDVNVLLSEVERLAASSDRWADYVALLRDVAPDVGDGELQIDSYRKIADTARRRLNDPELARGYYQRILDHQPDHAGALDALEQMTAEAGDHAALLDVLRRKSELASGRDRVTLLMRQAELCETKTGELPSAIDALEQVLSEDPAHAPAYVALERLYANAERWSDLAALFERMLEQRVGFAVEVRFKLGRLHREKLDDVSTAIEQFREALSLGAPHEPTVEQLQDLMRTNEEHRASAAAILEPIYLTRLAWPRVVEALEARLSGETELEGRKALLQRLGQVHEDYLEDLDGAMTVYARLFREDPRDEGAWETLSRLAKVLERWDRLADTYRGAIEESGVEDETTQRLAVMAAQLYDQRTNDAAKAAELYRKALRFSPEDQSTFRALESLLRRTSQWDSLLELYDEQAQVAPSDADRVSLLEKTALVLRDQKDEPDRAIEAFREVIAIEPAHAGATVALDALLTSRERWHDLSDHLRHRIDLTTDAKQAADLKHRLAVLSAEKLGDKTAAIDLLEDVTRDDPRHLPAVTELERLVTDPEHQLRIIQILEPIYQATDQWKKRIAVHEAQVALSDDALDRVRLLQEIARLHEERGRDRSLAFHAMARAMALDPGNEEVRAEVDRLGATLEIWNELVIAYEQAIAASTDPATTSSLLGTVARLHDEKRGDPRAAIVTYERLAEHDPEDASPLDALEALHTMVGDWRGMVDVLKRKVDRSYDPVERGELLRRAGSVMEDLLGDRGGAIVIYKQAVAEDPNDAVALESLDRLFSDANDHASLAEVLKRRVELEQEPELRAEVGLRLGQLAEEFLRDAETAIEAFVRVLEDQPGETTAVTSLARLYERQAMWPELLENLRLQAGMASDAPARVTLLHRAAEVLERELDDTPEAIESYRQVLEIDPRHEATLASLLRIVRLEDHRQAASEILLPLLREQGRWDDLAQVLELTAEASGDPIDKRDGLRALAEVHEQGRRDANAAFESYRRALAEDPSDLRTADDLERLAAQLGAWDRVADVFAARGSSALDPEIAKNLYGRLARIAEEKLGDDARAIEAYRRSLEQVGDDEDALGALDRLYLKSQSWPDLAEVLERRVQLANDGAARIDLLVRLGSLRWERQNDRHAAFTSFQEVLEAQPDEPRAIGAVEGLLADEDLAAQAVDALDAAYRRTSSTQKMAALYDVRVRLAEDGGERVALLQELAQLQENELRDPSAALATTVRAFEIDRRDEGLLGELERLAAIVSGWESLRGLIERVTSGGDDLDAVTRRDLELRAAGWYRDRLGDPGAAEGALRRAIAADRETADAHAQLVELLRAPSREAELVAALRAWSEVEYDELAKKERLREAARLAESALGDATQAITLHDAILETDGSDALALDDLIRLRMGAGAWPEVVELLERRIDVESDPDRRVELRRQLAHALAGPVGDPARAIEAWRAVIDEVATDLDAIGELETLYESAERWSDLEELIQRRLDIAETPADRIAARVRLARLSETRFGRRAEAIEQLHEILGEDPHNADALDELERLYAADGRQAELVDLLERRVADARDAETELDVLGRLAEARETGGETDAAAEVHQRILDRDPSREGSLRALARLHAAAGRHAEAADAIERLLPTLAPAERREESFRLVELATSKLNDQARAERALRGLHEDDPSDAEVRTRLKALYERTQRWAELAHMLALDEASFTKPADRIALFKRIADLHATKLSDAAGAASWLERAVQLEPDNRDVLLPLCDLYIAAGRQSDAIPVLEKIIASYGTRRSKEVALYQHRLGQALEGMGNTTGALNAYDAAFKVDLTNVQILRDLGRLCYTTGDYDRAQKTFRALLLQKLDGQSGITKGDVYFYLGDISAKQGDPKKAISMLERALAEESGHRQASALLSSLKS